MKNFKPIALFPLAIGLLLFAFASNAAGDDIPKSQLPVLNTSAGQSADVETLNVICEEAGIHYDYCDVPTVDLIKAGVGLADKESGPGFHVEVNTDLEKYPKGNKVPAALLKQGLAFDNIGDKANSRLILEDLIKKYPKSNEAKIAREKLKES